MLLCIGTLMLRPEISRSQLRSLSILSSRQVCALCAQVLNSVLQDNVVVADGVTIQNTILCAGVVVKERAALKDCQVGGMYLASG